MTRRSSFLFLALVSSVSGAPAVLAGGAAFACGAPFGSDVTVDPHQDIIITWRAGVETYVFQPTFCGAATDFGLIVPVPAQLSKEPTLSEQKAFDTAIALSEPAKREVVRKEGVGCGGDDGAVGAGGSAFDDQPAVVASGRVGFLDWAQLKAETVSSFTEWLDRNGYPHTSDASNVFAYYVSKGWYFLAFRVSQNVAPGGGTICQALGPVAFSFPTAVPIIPSYMAKAGGSSVSRLSWRIFGITSGDVQLAFPTSTDQYRGLWYSGAIKDADLASFAGLAQSGDRLTRLLLRLSSTGNADAELTLAAPKDYRGTEDIIVEDDSACSLGPHRRVRHGCILALFGLTMLGLVGWRRWR